MKPDVFGDLRDWGRVLALQRLFEEKGTLDEVQEGLIRLLKYRENWQVRERAVLLARQVKSPSDELLLAVLDMMNDRTTYLDARILAAQTLAQLAPRALARSDNGEQMRELILSRLSTLLGVVEPPVLSESIHKALSTVELAEMPTEAHYKGSEEKSYGYSGAQRDHAK